jgi:translin
MIDKNEFNKIRDELKAYEKKREDLIQLSRDVIRTSKQIIFSVHRNDLKGALKLVKEIKVLVKKLPLEYSETGIVNVARYEYVEALCFYEFTSNNKIPSKKELGIDVDSYLLGLADLTGELGRKAVNESIKNNFKEALKIKELIEEIYGEFLNFDLRNGELRQKYDAIKWNLKKVEELVYDNTKKK